MITCFSHQSFSKRGLSRRRHPILGLNDWLRRPSVVVGLSWRILSILWWVAAVWDSLGRSVDYWHRLSILTHLSLILLLHVVKSFSDLFFELCHFLVNLLSHLSVDDGLDSFSQVWRDIVKVIGVFLSVDVGWLFWRSRLQEVLRLLRWGLG